VLLTHAGNEGKEVREMRGTKKKVVVTLNSVTIDPVSLACHCLDFTGGWHGGPDDPTGNVRSGDVTVSFPFGEPRKALARQGPGGLWLLPGQKVVLDFIEEARAIVRAGGGYRER
jgi:hypothetical protein